MYQKEHRNQAVVILKQMLQWMLRENAVLKEILVVKQAKMDRSEKKQPKFHRQVYKDTRSSKAK